MMNTTADTIDAQVNAVKDHLRELEQIKRDRDTEAQKQKNLEQFLKRPPEYFVGRAHCDPNFIDARYGSERTHPILPMSVTVSGNCGETYRGEVPVTDNSRTYFHNIWTHRQRDNFTKRLKEFVAQEIAHITSSLTFVIAMMGLNDRPRGHYFYNRFPAGSEDAVDRSLAEARAEVLSKFSDDDFLALAQPGDWVNMDDGSREVRLHEVSHGTSILKQYLAEHRPHIHTRLFPD